MCGYCGFAGCGCRPSATVLFGAAIDGIFIVLWTVLTLIAVGYTLIEVDPRGLVYAAPCAFFAWCSIKRLQTRR